MSEPKPILLESVMQMGEEMLTAGAEELKHALPGEDPVQVVARVYTAMELVRIMLEHQMEFDSPEARRKSLN